MLLASLAVAPRAHAVAISSCGGEPFAFESADVNVVILPYFQSGPSPRQLNGLGSQLALLMKLEILYRAMAYDHWGIVLLTGPKKECDPDRIATDLLVNSRRAPQRIGSHHPPDQPTNLDSSRRSAASPAVHPGEACPELPKALPLPADDRVGLYVDQGSAPAVPD
jgi:hypothetical protein